MTGLVEMMLLKAMSASAARQENRRVKRNARARERAVVCSVCGRSERSPIYGRTMYKRGDGYICRDCRAKEGRK